MNDMDREIYCMERAFENCKHSPRPPTKEEELQEEVDLLTKTISNILDESFNKDLGAIQHLCIEVIDRQKKEDD